MVTLIATMAGRLLESVHKRVASQAATSRRSSALSPLLWLCAVVVPSCIYGAATTTSPTLRVALVLFAAIPLLATIGAYFYFLFKDRDRLHTEDHIVQMRALEMIAEKGGSTLVLSSASVEMVANPEPESKPVLVVAPAPVAALPERATDTPKRRSRKPPPEDG